MFNFPGTFKNNESITWKIPIKRWKQRRRVKVCKMQNFIWIVSQ